MSEPTCSRGLLVDVDGQDTSVLAHRFDHVLTAVLRTGPCELDYNDGSGTPAAQGQPIVDLIAQERAPATTESSGFGTSGVRSTLSRMWHSAGDAAAMLLTSTAARIAALKVLPLRLASLTTDS